MTPGGAGAGLVGDLVAFGTRLRAEGVPVDATRLAAFASACAELTPVHAYWAGRATLVTGHAQIAAYDRAFAAHFGGADPAAPDPPTDLAPSPGVALDPPDAPAEAGDDVELEVTPASAVERLRHRRFEDCTEEELRQIAALVRRIAWGLPPRATRRRAPARRGTPDVQRTLRRALRAQDGRWDLERHARRSRRRRLLLVLDVSGSMAATSRVLLTFAHGALSADASWEAFCFGTRLTRLTPALRAGRPDAAIAAASDEVRDWGGGTRIGASLKALLDGWGQTRAVRGAIVVICSDGLEVGDPELVGTQMARLARSARTVTWLNPLKGLEGYAPLAGGMAAALPHVDRFESGDTLAALEEVAVRLASDARRTAVA